jgi:DUF1365 family protein
MTEASSLYVGTVMHRRYKPHQHRLRYRVFWMLLDLDELGALGERLWLFSAGRANLFSFHDRDHGNGTAESLRVQIGRLLTDAGIATDGGPVRLLCMPRVFGYAFNPLSVYFCHHSSGELAAILYEVNNTFGERHSYLIPVKPASGGLIEQHCAKELYVSPFMPMEMTYDFRIAPPGQAVSVTVRGSDGDGLMIAAALTGRRTALTDANLLKLTLAIPLVTLKVTAGIHWEALKMWLKRFRLVPRPRPPVHAVTVVGSSRTETTNVV